MSPDSIRYSIIRKYDSIIRNQNKTMEHLRDLDMMYEEVEQEFDRQYPDQREAVRAMLQMVLVVIDTIKAMKETLT